MTKKNHRKELRRLAKAATPGPWEWDDDDERPGLRHGISFGGLLLRCGTWYGPDEKDASYIAAANPAAVLGLLDRLAHMTEARDNARAEVERLTGLWESVREQVANGALCPMCCTGMTRRTVGMACQLCGTDYSSPEYASLRRDSEQTSKAVLAAALASACRTLDADDAKMAVADDWEDLGEDAE